MNFKWKFIFYGYFFYFSSNTNAMKYETYQNQKQFSKSKFRKKSTIIKYFQFQQQYFF